MPEPIDTVLSDAVADRLLIRQAESIKREEQSVIGVIAAFDDFWRDLLRAIVDDEDRSRALIRAAFSRARAPIENAIESGLIAVGEWGYASAFDAIAGVLPREYLAVPTEPEDVQLQPLPEQVAPSVFGSNSEHSASALYDPPDYDEILKIVRSPGKGWGGEDLTWKERIEKLSSRASGNQDEIAKVIARGMARGDHPSVIARRLRKHVAGYRAGAARIARTESGRVSSVLAQRGMNSFGHIVAGYRIMATLDDKTRPHHALRHGTAYYKDGTPSVDDMPFVPDEPNCRCYTSPIVRTRNNIMSRIHSGDFSFSAQGGEIKDPGTFGKYWEKQSDKFQKKIVGPSRWKEVTDKLPSGSKPQFVDFFDPDSGRLVPRLKLERESLDDLLNRRQTLNTAINQREQQLKALTLSGKEIPGIPGIPAVAPAVTAPTVPLTPDIPDDLKSAAQVFHKDPEEAIKLARSEMEAAGVSTDKLSTLPYDEAREKYLDALRKANGFDFDAPHKAALEIESAIHKQLHSKAQSATGLANYGPSRHALREYLRSINPKLLEATVDDPAVDARAWLKKIKLRWRRGKQYRADSFAPFGGEGASIRFHPRAMTPRSLIHELTHQLEYANPDIAKRWARFRDLRTAGEDWVDLGKKWNPTKPSKHGWEWTKEDRFFNEYFGKQYFNGRNRQGGRKRYSLMRDGKSYDVEPTECFAMSAQTLGFSADNWTDAISKDPEVLEMLWACLRGY